MVFRHKDISERDPIKIITKSFKSNDRDNRAIDFASLALHTETTTDTARLSALYSTMAEIYTWCGKELKEENLDADRINGMLNVVNRLSGLVNAFTRNRSVADATKDSLVGMHNSTLNRIDGERRRYLEAVRRQVVDGSKRAEDFGFTISRLGAQIESLEAKKKEAERLMRDEIKKTRRAEDEVAKLSGMRR